MTLLLGSALKLEGGEEVVRIGQEDLRLLEEDARRRVGNKAMNLEEGGTFAIDVIGVRGVAEKGRVRSRSHEVRRFGELGGGGDLKLTRFLDFRFRRSSSFERLVSEYLTCSSGVVTETSSVSQKR